MQTITIDVEKLTVADRVRRVYDKLSEKSKDGGVTAHEVLEASRPKDAPLHNQFTWDDNRAAEKQRLNEARKLLQLIKIEHEPGRRVRGFRNLIIEVNGTKSRKYYTIEKIMQDDSLKKKVLHQLLKELRSALERYKNYQEVFDLINEPVLERLEQKILTL